MSEQEAGDITLREMLRQHINSSNEKNTQILVSLAEIKTDQKHFKEQIDDHDKSIGGLKKTIWTAFGTGMVGIIHAIKSALS